MRSIFLLLKKINSILNRKQKSLAVFIMIGSIIAAALETLGVSIIVPLVNVLLEPEVLLRNRYVVGLCNLFEINSDSELVALVIVGVIILYIVKNLYFSLFCLAKTSYACYVQREVSLYMLESYTNRGYSYFLNHNANEMRQGVEFDVNHLYNTLISLIQIVSQATIVLMISLYMCISDWQIAASVVVASLFCLSFIFLVFRKSMTKAGKDLRLYNILSSQVLLELLHGFKEVFVLRKQKYFMEDYRDKLTKRQNAQIKQYVGEEIPAYVIEAVCISCIMIVMGLRMSTIENPSAFVAVLASFAVGAFRILPALGKVSASVNLISTSITGLNSVYENVVESRQYVLDYNKYDAEDTINKDEFVDKLCIADIEFGYSKDLPKVLSGVNFNISKGDAIALIGESGAGKSTLADIVLGLLQPESGNVLIDGIDINNIPLAWSRIVGFVPQSIYLSDNTIVENIAFGIAKENISYDAVVKAAKMASLDKFVVSLPQGYDTVVGDRGVRLSGGQRQRIGIARALYHNPQILILDEATSALDNDTEDAVMEAIDALQGQVTLIIIAHRLTTIKNCNHIYKIENGVAVKVDYNELAKR